MDWPAIWLSAGYESCEAAGNGGYGQPMKIISA